VKGSEVIFPVVFKTLATRQYAPVREFRRRVRLALEENGLLPGDPNRVFSTFSGKAVRGAIGQARRPFPRPTQPRSSRRMGVRSAARRGQGAQSAEGALAEVAAWSPRTGFRPLDGRKTTRLRPSALAEYKAWSAWRAKTPGLATRRMG